MTKLESRCFPAGTIVHMQGIPVALVTETHLETHPGNWKEIDKTAALLSESEPESNVAST